MVNKTKKIRRKAMLPPERKKRKREKRRRSLKRLRNRVSLMKI